MGELRLVTAKRDIDGAWRAIELQAGGHTERFEGALAGEKRYPALADLAAWLASQGFVEINRHEQDDRLLVTFRQPAPATLAQQFASWLEQQAQDAPAEQDAPAPEPTAEAEATRAHQLELARQVVKSGLR